MKKIALLLAGIALLGACKKDINGCKTYTQITGLESTPDGQYLLIECIVDTLAAHPQLKLHEFSTFGSGWTASFRVFRNGLQVLDERYVLTRNNVSNEINSFGTMPSGSATALSLSTVPEISYKDAIEQAKRYANFDHTCISYQLGFYKASFNASEQLSDYRLAWKITGEHLVPSVTLDANTGELLQVGRPIYDF